MKVQLKVSLSLVECDWFFNCTRMAAPSPAGQTLAVVNRYNAALSSIIDSREAGP